MRRRRTSGATDIGVGDRRPLRGLRGPSAMQVVLQDREHRAVGQRVRHGPRTGGGIVANSLRHVRGGLHGGAAMGSGHADDAEAGAEALLGVGLGVQDHVHQPRGIRSDPGCAALVLVRRDASVTATAGRHVVGQGGVPAVARGSDMRGDVLAFVDHLQRSEGLDQARRL